MTDQSGEIPAVNADREKAHEVRRYVRRAGNLNFRIPTDDNGVRMVPCVAPAPDHGLAQDHERRQFVEGVVQPVRFECGSVPRLVPTRVRGRGVEHGIQSVRNYDPPGAPQGNSAPPR